MSARRRTFAQIRCSLLVGLLAAAVSACSSAPEESSETAESAVGTATRVKDLRTTSRFFRAHGASPSAAVTVGSRTLFFASTGPGQAPQQTGLYATDGTAAGTSLVTALASRPWGRPTVHQGIMYFITSRALGAPSWGYAYELQRTDGTAAGSTAITSIAGNMAAVMENASGVFVATTERTPAATLVRLARLTRRPDGSDAAEILREVTVESEHGYAQLATNGGGCILAIGGKVLVSDGTPAGTVEVASERSVAKVVASDTRYFFVEPSTSVAGASELFEVLGASASPRVRGYGALASASRPASAVQAVSAVGDRLALITKSDVWTADTSNGTVTSYPHVFAEPPSTALLGGKLYALGGDGALVQTDGTAAGTHAITTTRVPGGAFAKPAADLVAHAGDLYFFQNDAAAGRQLVRFSPMSDTRSVVSSFPRGAELENLRSGGSWLTFAAGGYGKEQWSWDGTTFTMLEVNRHGNASSNPSPIVAAGARLFFAVNEDVDWSLAQDGTEQTLWTTEGTSATTTMLRTGNYSFYTDRYRTPAAASVGARACIVESALHKRSVVCTDGTATGTTAYPLAAEIPPLVHAGAIYFVSRAGANGCELLRYDANAGVASVVIALGQGSTVRELVAREHDLLMMVESNDAASRGIWTTDGTPAGSVRMVPNVPFIGAQFRVVGNVGDVLYVTGPGGLFKTDGTATGTGLVAQTPWQKPLSFPRGAAAGTRLVFPVQDPGHATGDNALWVTEGTAATTHPLFVDASDAFYSAPVAYDGRVAFRSDKAVIVTGGDRAATFRHPLTEPGAMAAIAGKGLVVSVYKTSSLLLVEDAKVTPLESGRPTYMNLAPIPFGGGLVFPGPLDGRGTELLFTNGEIGGARVLTAVEPTPGAGSSDPKGMTLSTNRLYFAAQDDKGDRELYALPLSAVP